MRIGTLIIIGLLAGASGVDPVGAVWEGDEDDSGLPAEEFVIDFIVGLPWVFASLPLV